MCIEPELKRYIRRTFTPETISPQILSIVLPPRMLKLSRTPLALLRPLAIPLMISRRPEAHSNMYTPALTTNLLVTKLNIIVITKTMRLTSQDLHPLLH